MNYSAIEHHAFDNYCYMLNADELCISIKTGKDISRVQIVAGDPFDGGVMGDKGVWNAPLYEMTERIELESHFLWSIVLHPQFKRLRYYFIVTCDNRLQEQIALTESGFCSVQDAKSGKFSEFFIFPWMNPADIIAPPEWVKSCVWYQIFPARFARGKNPCEKRQYREWGKLGESVTNKDSFGGNIQGMIDRLDYLKELGITGIYTTPLNLSPSEHKYNTTDYLTVDSDFGSNETLSQFVKEAHARRIRVMFDAVFNHCGRDFFAWQDVLQNRENSKYRNWFFINDFDIRPYEANAHKGKFYAFAFVDDMPKLNTSNPEVQEYFINVCKKWICDYDIDGLRLDVANEPSHDFWKNLYRNLKAVKSDFYIMGEIWHNSLPWLREKEFDSVMNYPLKNAITNFLAYTEMNAQQFEFAINRCNSMYYKQTTQVLFNQVDSHDTIRIRNRLGGSKEKAMQALAILFAMPGSPCIYYGTEILLEGGHDPDNRRCMPWPEIDAGQFANEIEFCKKLIAIRKEHPAMRNTEIQLCYSPLDVLKGNEDCENGRLLHILKTCDCDNCKERIHIFVNATDFPQPIAINENVEILLALNLNANELGANGIAIIKE